jgi:ubiquinone/menaquinone biosynthesis C-methylase UbiE
MAKLYDRADIYDLIESDVRTEIIRKDWEEFLGNRKIDTVLDVSIGSGGLTLPLQDLGIEVYGSDLSEAMLSKCATKANKKGKSIELKCSDFRDLSCWEDRLFDCVVSSGNSLAYVSNEDVLKTLEQMDAHVKQGGFLCFDSRNWEMIQRENQRFYFYKPMFKDGNRINLIQVWDHNSDGSITFNLVYTFERDNHIFQKEVFEEHYNPFPKDMTIEKMEAMGYTDIEIKPFPCNVPETDFDKIDWYRVIGHKPA